jgi:hypothetical protein
VCQQIVEMQDAIALVSAQVSNRQQAREPAPGGAVARIGKHVRRAVGEDEPHAWVIGKRQVLLAPGQMRAHHAGD